MQARGIRQADGVLLSRFAYAQWVLGCPLQNPAQPTPTVPPPPTFSNGSPCEHLYCVSLKYLVNVGAAPISVVLCSGDI